MGQGFPTLPELRDILAQTGGNVTATARMFGMDRNTLRTRLGDQLINMLIAGDSVDADVVELSVKLAKQKQKACDLNRVERKGFREHARIENAVAGYAGEIAGILKGIKFSAPPKIPASKKSGYGCIVHWSDQHLNELVQLSHNTYDWTVAGKRLRKHVLEALETCERKGIKHVLVAMTGDLLNSDRRLDELLSNAGNRAKASVLAVDLYQQALRELRSKVNVSVCCVSGNESRIPKDIGWSAEVASDNYDFAIYEMLRLLLDRSGISFMSSSDPGEMVVNVAGRNCLFLHGHGSLRGKTQEAVQSIKGRYLARGVAVDYVFWGHIHDAMIGDGYARSSSLVGSNDYGEKSLGLAGRASQNLYLIRPEGGFDGIKVDLQNTDHIEGYCVQSRLEAYNTKSAAKTRQHHTVFEVVV